MTLTITNLFYLTTFLTPVASKPRTGFKYGALWGFPENLKYMKDFRDGFNYARNLTATIPFDSARFFNCRTQGTKDVSTGAFDAAVQTKTNLLLGFWITPAKRGNSLDDTIKNERAVLEQGFVKHDQSLANLIIGLSIGSEEIHLFEDTQKPRVPSNDVSAVIKKVKDAVTSSCFVGYMKGKSIGHVDTVKHVVVDGADFYCMTTYPYWNDQPVPQAKESFLGSLKNVKQRAGNTPVWIAEIGWPYEGVRYGQAVASVDDL